MIRRRDIMIGGASLAAAGGAYALTPRHRLLLAKDLNLETAIPKRFGRWSQEDAAGVVQPKNEDDLASKLYSQIVSRVYRRRDDGATVMLLIAYGDTQNDLLQLHRPEVCYAAFGFRISDSRVQPIAIEPGLDVPARELTATAPERAECITYWTRIGEYLPVDGRQQRTMKLRTQFAGIIPDGVLVRVSSNLEDHAASFALNREFAADLLRTIRPAARVALVGNDVARRIA